MSITVVPLSTVTLTEQIDALVEVTPSSWFWHRPKWRDYEMARNPRLLDYSWAVMDGDEPVASQLLTYNPDLRLFGLGDLGAPFAAQVYASTSRQFEFISALMDETFGRIVRHIPAQVRFRSMPLHAHFYHDADRETLVSPLDNAMGHSPLWLSESCRTRVIDLSVPIEELWSALRKSYRHTVLDSEARLVVSKEHNDQTWRLCQWLHMKASGRQTRPSESWVYQDSFVHADEASWFLAKDQKTEELVGFAYVIHWKQWAYYASAASLRPNVSHALQWKIIQDLKARGVRYYEIGHQGQDASKKGKGIEFFRRGFGGVDVVQPIYSTDLLMRTDNSGSVH